MILSAKIDTALSLCSHPVVLGGTSEPVFREKEPLVRITHFRYFVTRFPDSPLYSSFVACQVRIREITF